MKIDLDSIDPVTSNLDCLIIGLFEGEEEVSSALKRVKDLVGDSLDVLLETGEISGRFGNNVLIHSLILNSKNATGLKESYFADLDPGNFFLLPD